MYEADSQTYRESEYRYRDPDGRRFALGDIASPNPRPNLMYEWQGHQPPPKGWRFSLETMTRLEQEGRIYYRGPGKRPRVKRYLDEMKGTRVGSVWADLPNVHPWSNERLGYPTQKPVALLERIISASSNPGDIVLDPFCGCGTALVAAQKLDRRWIGIDITWLSIAVMRARLKDSFALDDVPVIGSPTEVEGARQLARQSLDGRYQFQYWALSLVDAKPVGGAEKKGADRGIDGKITFTGRHGELQSVLVSVKSGAVTPGMVRDLKGTIEREKAAIGLFVTLEEPTREMRLEADTAGLYEWELFSSMDEDAKAVRRDFPRLQILTIRELLDGKKPQLPPMVYSTYQLAERVPRAKAADQQELFG